MESIKFEIRCSFVIVVITIIQQHPNSLKFHGFSTLLQNNCEILRYEANCQATTYVLLRPLMNLIFSRSGSPSNVSLS